MAAIYKCPVEPSDLWVYMYKYIIYNGQLHYAYCLDIGRGYPESKPWFYSVKVKVHLSFHRIGIALLSYIIYFKI